MSGWWATSYIVLWILVVVLTILVVALARQVGTLLVRVSPTGALEIDDEGPALGEAPEPVTIDGPAGEVVIGGAGERQFLLFVSPGCRICAVVKPGLRPAARAGGFVPYLLADDSDPDDPAANGDRPLVAPGGLLEAYKLPGTPYAVLLDEMGVVRAKGTVNNLEQMEGLVDTAARRIDEAMEVIGK